MPLPLSKVGVLSPLIYAAIAGLSVASLAGLVKFLRRLANARFASIPRDSELAELRKELDAVRRAAQEKADGLTVLEKELEGMRSRAKDDVAALEGARKHAEELEEQLDVRTREAREHKEELTRLNDRHTQTLQLLEARTLELRGAEAFLTKADALSGADVIGLLNTLNSEIYQTAAIIAEAFEFKTKAEREGKQRIEEEEEIMDEVYVSAGEIVGERMLELLKSSEHGDDPTLIQIAFQASMAAYSNWICTSWDLDDPEDESGLHRVYMSIRESEEQAVSGRWRALTRTHIPNIKTHDLAMYFMDAFVNILLAADVATSRPKLQEAIESRFADRVDIIVRGAQKLRRAIGEEVTSCDFEVVYIAHDSPYTPAEMDDAFAAGFEKGREDAADPEPVLCTTELGLARIVKVPGKAGEWEETLLLRPKIALKSGIDEMMVPESATAA
ncbi:hypothetical protein H0H81_009313 [Sphagnurus paluster]|uniref:Uncharacterized protein n=1 Tax=Sphagnurus paluster TaxID=117069 RepID=A0A9P7FVI3_9AGAR|nr:hypothetical protein H0H81_009313 [Sphagnurus paluster]